MGYGKFLGMGYKKFLGMGYEKFFRISVDIFALFSCERFLGITEDSWEKFLGVSTDFSQNCYLGHIICPTTHLSYTSFVLQLIYLTHHLSYRADKSSFVLHIIKYIHIYICYILFIMNR